MKKCNVEEISIEEAKNINGGNAVVGIAALYFAICVFCYQLGKD